MDSTRPKTVVLPDLMASLQLTRYLVEDLTFKCNVVTGVKKENPDAPITSVDFNIKENREDKNQYLLDMVVNLNPDQDPNKFDTYQIHLHLYGWFTFTADLDQQTKAKMIASNASAMLYGIARSIVANLTGSMGPKQFILPTLNLLAIIKAKSKAESEKVSKVSNAAPVKKRSKT